MKSNLLYHKLAKYYDLIYSDKPYEQEAAFITKTIMNEREKNIKANTGRINFSSLLDLACGTGNHIKHLSKHFQCIGMDNSREMLDIAIKKNPDCKFTLGDMKKEIPGKYDVIISLFSSIAYIETYSNFRLVAENISNALTDGGIVILQSWYESGNFTPGIPFIKTFDNDVKLLRMAAARVEGICSITEYHYLIYENNKIEHIVDRHKMALFNIEKLIGILKWFGIDANYIESKNGRGLIIGTKKEI